MGHGRVTKKAAIIGAGLMGTATIRDIVTNLSRYIPTFYDSDRSKLTKLANERDVRIATTVEEAIEGASLVALCTSLETREEAILRTARLVEPDALYFDIFGLKSIASENDPSRVKTTTLEMMVNFSPEGVSVFSIHPMHGPGVLPRNQKYPYIVGRDAGNSEQGFVRLFRGVGAQVFRIPSAEHHDKNAAVVQAQLWMAKLSTAEAVISSASQLGISLESIADFSSFLYVQDMSLNGRIINGNHDVYADGMLLNPYFHRIVGTLSDIVGRRKNEVLGLNRAELLDKLLELKKGGLSKHIPSLTPPHEAGRSTILIYRDGTEAAISQVLGYEVKGKTYAAFAPTYQLKEVEIKSGDLGKIYGNFPVARAAFWKSKGRRGITRINGQWGFTITNGGYPKKLGNSLERLSFSPLYIEPSMEQEGLTEMNNVEIGRYQPLDKTRLLIEPEQAPLPTSMRIQLFNRYADPYLNLFSSYRRHGFDAKIGPLVGLYDHSLAPFRELIRKV